MSIKKLVFFITKQETKQAQCLFLAILSGLVRGRLLALTTNIIPGWCNLPGTNTLTCYKTL